MNKVIIFLLLGIIVLSIQCERAVWSRISEYTLENKTDNTFFVFMYPIDLYAYIRDTVRGYIEPEKTFSHKFYEENYTYTHFRHLFAVDFFLYNLTDTTSIQEEVYGGSGEYNNYKFIKHYVNYAGYTNNKNNEILRFHKLTISKSLIQIMQKDYTMLEKFKDYYATPH